MRALHLVAGLALTAALAGCSDDGDDKKGSGGGATAEDVAAAIQDKVTGLEQVTITEDNDPNELIGRPNGYVSAVVLKDSRLDDCGDDLGVDCGATLEEWPDADAAKKRAEYIEGLQEDSPMLGTEYHYFDGAVLVRVSGNLKPSEADEYKAALK